MKRKVLFCKWGIYGENSLIKSWKELGYDVTVYNKKDKGADYDVICMKEMGQLLLKEAYQYVFTMNYLPVVSRTCQIFDIPYVSWTVDSPEFMLFSKTLENSCNYVFLFDKDMVKKFGSRNQGHIFYMPLGTDMKVWDKVTVSTQEREKYTSDISFVGSFYTEKSKYRSYDMDKELPNYLRGFCNGLVEAQLKVYGYNFLDEIVTEEMAREFKKYAGWEEVADDYVDVTKETVANDFLGLRCSELERVRVLNRLTEEFEVDIYTNSNHSEVPKGNYKGLLGYYDTMPKVFRCSKINLNITSKSIKTGIPLRIFDILGAGGFLITNYQAELPEYFEIGRELVVYDSEEDLVEKIKYYLEHEKERLEIAKNGYERVKKEYRWEQRLQDILEIMGELQKDKG